MADRATATFDDGVETSPTGSPHLARARYSLGDGRSQVGPGLILMRPSVAVYREW